jgi:hypothetical protein
MLAIGHDQQEYALDQPYTHAIATDLTCALCGRSSHHSSTFHKCMNHVIGEAFMKAHPKETARVMREHNNFVTLGPRGTPRYKEGTKLPSSSIRAVMASKSSGDATLPSRKMK